MNKKYVYVSLLAYHIVIFSAESDQKVVTPNDASIVAEFEPGTFSEQLAYVAERMAENTAVFNNFLRSQYNQWVLGQEIPKQLIKSKKPSNKFVLTQTHKYLVATSICIIIASIAYKYGWFSAYHDLPITEEEVQELVEGVVRDQLVANKDKLNKVFELLLQNGLDNIVVYNEHTFEVNDMFRVEINDMVVKVSRCA